MIHGSCQFLLILVDSGLCSCLCEIKKIRFKRFKENSMSQKTAMEKKNLRSEFVVAAEKGNVAEVMKLSEDYMKLPMPEKQTKFYPALYIAAFTGHEDIVKILLQKGADPNFSLENYLPPLHAAAKNGNENIVQLLLKRGAQVNPKLKIKSGKKSQEVDYFSSPLLIAVTYRHAGVAQLLLQKGADVNTKLQPLPSKTFDVRDEFEKRLIAGSYQRDEFSSDSDCCVLGYSPLHFAVKYSTVDLVNLLLKYGADVNSKSTINVTPLAIALANNHESIIQILLKAGADTKVQVNRSPLLYHILYQQFHDGLGEYDEYDKHKDIEKKNSFRLLLKLGADPNGWSEKEKKSVLHFAAGHGEVHAVHLLLKHGADINTLDGEGNTPFQYAVDALKECLEKIQDQYYSSTRYSDSDSDYGYDFDGYGGRTYEDSSEEEAHEKEREERRREHEQEREEEYKKRKIYNLSSKKYVYNMYQYRYDCDHDEGYGVFQDPEPFRIICQRLTRELLRQEASGKTIVKQNVDLLKSAFVKPYVKKLKSEINKMKKTAASEDPKATFYDILLANESKLKEFGNKNILASAKNVDYEKLFPNYANYFKNCLKKGVKRKHPGDESHGSSDEEEPKASVQKKPKSRRRARFGRRDGCVLS